MTGGVLNTINIRLDANTIAYILEHSEAKVLVVDRQLHVEVKKALDILNKKIIVIDINDKHADQSKLEKIGDLEYESFLNTGDENYNWKIPEGSSSSKGKSLFNILPLKSHQAISSIMPMPEDETDLKNYQIIFATAQGKVRKREYLK